MSFEFHDLPFYALAVYCEALANVDRLCNFMLIARALLVDTADAFQI